MIRRSSRSLRDVFLPLASLGVLAGLAAADDPPAAKPEAPKAAAAGDLKPFRDEIAGTTLAVEMVPVVPKDGSKPFYIAKFETSWDLYDTFVFGFDKQAGKSTAESDAVTRPTKPYIATDRGYGHAGFPAISMSFIGAKRYAEWLSVKTGRKYRLPTVKEWQAACELAAVPVGEIGDYAWYADNSGTKTHEIGKKKADALGLFDLWGNVGEWCVNEESKGVVMGPTFRDGTTALACTTLKPYTPDWNTSDPQFPKSKWWLADADFVGFRVICDP